MHKKLCVLLLVSLGWAAVIQADEAAGWAPARLKLKSHQILDQMSPLMYAVYLKPTGVDMFKPTGSSILDPPDNKNPINGFHSFDNGQSWTQLPANPNFENNLPHGYRREAFPTFVDPENGNLVKVVPSLDTPGLDPSTTEPPVALEKYYLRYRVSTDGGKSFLFDEPIVQEGKTPENPFDGVYKGKNGIFMGDVGSQLIRTRQGNILIPAQACKLDPDGRLWSPGGNFTYTDVILILGRWRPDNRITWKISRPIEADPARSTRGMIEPTVAEMSDGRLLCVMRGSNGGVKDETYQLPSYRWWSVSRDGGFHWTKPQPWTYDNGTAFFSPSSMSQLIHHSSGRVFWIGNISQANCRGNDPRYPLLIGEVHPTTLRLIESTLLVVDMKRADEPGVNLSHWWGFEDRKTSEIVIAGARHSQTYKEATPALWRIAVQ